MQDVVLLVSTSAIFVFGYFLMNKLDAFLENNWNEQETALTYGENSLQSGQQSVTVRITFSIT